MNAVIGSQLVVIDDEVEDIGAARATLGSSEGAARDAKKTTWKEKRTKRRVKRDQSLPLSRDEVAARLTILGVLP